MNAARSNSIHSAGRCPRPPAKFLWLAWAAVGAMLWGQPLQADGLEGRFEVRSADLQLKDGVYHLNAHMDLPVSEAATANLLLHELGFLRRALRLPQPPAR